MKFEITPAQPAGKRQAIQHKLARLQAEVAGSFLIAVWLGKQIIMSGMCPNIVVLCSLAVANNVLPFGS